MPTENEFVVATFEDPSVNILKDYVGHFKIRPFNRWKPSDPSHLLIFMEQYEIDKTKIDAINKLKDRVHLLLVHKQEDDSNFMIKEFAINISQKILNRTLTFSSKEYLSRIVGAWGSGAEHKLISDAYLVDDKLVVTDCASVRYEIDSKYLPEIKVDGKPSSNFEIHSDGSYLYWVDFDFHINIDGLRSRFDDKFRVEQAMKYLHLNKRFGDNIKALRESHSLKQTDFGKISDRQIRRIESGDSFPSYNTLKTMSDVHGLGITEYLRMVSEGPISKLYRLRSDSAK
jgi:DNA-binding transcriptional regulator YiaG